MEYVVLRSSEGIKMITYQEVIRRLDVIAKEIRDLKQVVEQGWSAASTQDPTRAFLEKCGGWEDTRSVEEIIASIYTARTISERGAAIFNNAPVT
jgi:hypothetical protein